jgi:hypothetical protein
LAAGAAHQTSQEFALRTPFMSITTSGCLVKFQFLLLLRNGRSVLEFLALVAKHCR